MNLKKLFLLIVILLTVSSFFIFAQTEEIGSTDPSKIGVSTAQQDLKEVSVTKFEDSGMWAVSIWRDNGIASVRKIKGSPLGKEPIEDEAAIGLNEADDYVLGTKVDFFKRAVTSFSVYPIKPIPVEGICKTVSVWVIGRNTEHVLKLMVKDLYGNKAEVTFGKLNFTGWKKMTAVIPEKIKQQDYHFARNNGLEIEGFKIECNPAESYGTYYIYFDDLRAVTDLFPESNRDEDDMVDMW